MNKLTFTLYLLKDAFGKTHTIPVDDPSDNVPAFSMQDANGDMQSFESEAYHLESHCKDCGIEMKKIEIERNFDEVWNSETL